MLKAIVRLIAITAVFSTLLVAQERASTVQLTGHVYLPDGKPLSGARVSLFPLEVGVGGPLPATISKEDGSYHLTVPALGKTRILANIEQRGYPDTFYKIFSSPADHFPEVNLSPGAVLDNIDIHLGSPDGLVEGRVIDKSNGAAVQSMQIVLRWVDQPSVYLSASIQRSGSFQYALPMRPISITISAPGYQTWTYSDPVTHAQYLLLGTTDRRSITVELTKSGTNSVAHP